MYKKFRFIFSFIFVITLLVLSFSPAQASSIPDQKITIKTYFRATSAEKSGESSIWPKIILFANNADNFDGPMDFGSCLDPAESALGQNCGTQPLYDNKKIDSFEVGAATFTQTTVTSSDRLFLFPNSRSPDFGVTKLSYVFYNDYWNPGTKQDRNVYITKIEFMGPDNVVFKKYDTGTDSYYFGHGEDNLKQSFYFDYGLVNLENSKKSDQYGVSYAFDKKELESIITNKSRENEQWSLGKEGSFNVVSSDLSTIFKAKYPGTPDSLTKTCSVSVSTASVEAGKTVTATFTGSTSRTTAEKVQMYIKKQDNSRISPTPDGTTEVVSATAGVYYYKFNTTCNTSNNTLCTATVTVPAQATGKYQLHCDLGTAPSSCSGNPNCAYEGLGGSMSCAGFQSCSTVDNATLDVVAATPTVVNPDYNGNHVVDIYDYNTLLTYFGQTKCSLNLVGTCLLDQSDFDKLVSVFATEY